MRGSVNQRYQLAVPEASAILGEAVEAVLVASDLEDRERVRVCVCRGQQLGRCKMRF